MGFRTGSPRSSTEGTAGCALAYDWAKRTGLETRAEGKRISKSLNRFKCRSSRMFRPPGHALARDRSSLRGHEPGYDFSAAS
jgi:hypothetical protein